MVVDRRRLRIRGPDATVVTRWQNRRCNDDPGLYGVVGEFLPNDLMRQAVEPRTA